MTQVLGFQTCATINCQGSGDGAQDFVDGSQALCQLSYKLSPILSLMLGTKRWAFHVLNPLSRRVPALLKDFPRDAHHRQCHGSTISPDCALTSTP